MGDKRITIPFILVMTTAVLLTGLGLWQLQRRDGRSAYIARMNERMHEEAVSLDRAKELWRKPEEAEYTRVVVVGTYVHDQERYLYAHIGGQPGWSVITPLVTATGDVVLVNRGFVPEERKDPASRKEGLIAGPVEIKGIALLSEQTNWFTPVNNVSGNRWFWRDIPALAGSLRPEQTARVAQFLLDSDAMPVPGDWPRSGITRVQIPNWHLVYAIACIGLAGALLMIYTIRRLRPRRQNDIE